MNQGRRLARHYRKGYASGIQRFSKGEIHGFSATSLCFSRQYPFSTNAKGPEVLLRPTLSNGPKARVITHLLKSTGDPTAPLRSLRKEAGRLTEVPITNSFFSILYLFSTNSKGRRSSSGPPCQMARKRVLSRIFGDRPANLRFFLLCLRERDSVLLHPVTQGVPADVQEFGGLGDIPPGMAQGLFDHLPL